MSFEFVVTAARAFGPSLAHMTAEELGRWSLLMSLKPVEAPRVPRLESCTTAGDVRPRVALPWHSDLARASDDEERSRRAYLVLTGQPQAGKDLIAETIVKRYARVARLAFSDTVMIEVNKALSEFAALGGSMHEIHEGNKNYGPYRKLLQDWGMLQRRVFGERYWGAKVFVAAKELCRHSKARLAADLVIITGARSPADVEVCAGNGAAVWRVDRPALPPNDHPVEHLLDHVPAGAWDAYVVNHENDLEGLRRQVETFLPHSPRAAYKVFLDRKENK